MCFGHNNIFHFLCECVLLLTEPHHPWEGLPGAIHHTNPHTHRVCPYSCRDHILQLSLNTRHHTSTRAQSTPIAILLHRRASKAIGKCGCVCTHCGTPVLYV